MVCAHATLTHFPSLLYVYSHTLFTVCTHTSYDSSFYPTPCSPQSKYSDDKWAKGTIYRASFVHYTIKFDHEGRTFEGCYCTTRHNAPRSILS